MDPAINSPYERLLSIKSMTYEHFSGEIELFSTSLGSSMQKIGLPSTPALFRAKTLLCRRMECI
jgi:hypothetical protein